MPISDTGDLKSVDKNEPSCSLRDAVPRREFREGNSSLATGTVAMKSQKVIDNRRCMDMLERLSFQDRIGSRTGRDGPIKDHFIPSVMEFEFPLQTDTTTTTTPVVITTMKTKDDSR
jgi:hypothetical protein